MNAFALIAMILAALLFAIAAIMYKLPTPAALTCWGLFALDLGLILQFAATSHAVHF